jgi:hypothetical protein
MTWMLYGKAIPGAHVCHHAAHRHPHEPHPSVGQNCSTRWGVSAWNASTYFVSGPAPK